MGTSHGHLYNERFRRGVILRYQPLSDVSVLDRSITHLRKQGADAEKANTDEGTTSAPTGIDTTDELFDPVGRALKPIGNHNRLD